MLASEVIERLKQLIDEHDDLIVHIEDADDTISPVWWVIYREGSEVEDDSFFIH